MKICPCLRDLCQFGRGNSNKVKSREAEEEELINQINEETALADVIAQPAQKQTARKSPRNMDSKNNHNNDKIKITNYF